MTIAGTTYTITQIAPAGCASSISPTSRSFTSEGGSGNSTVSAASTCAWSAESNVAWIAVLNGGPGKGNGTVTFIVGTNSSGVSRTGTLTIAGKIFNVTQTSTAACTYTVTPTALSIPSSARTAGIGVTTQTGCSWSVSGAPAWITFTGGGSGSGNLVLTISANDTKTPRSASMTIAGQTVTVTQNGRVGAPKNIRIIK
jgi:hypothetical protein